MKPKDLPIGYWIKKADQLLTEGIDHIQAKFGLTRTGWQMLNAINENKEITRSELFELMKPFAGRSAVNEILTSFNQNSLVGEGPDKIFLTEKGAGIHDNCLAQQALFRQHCMKDISESEYLITLSTLKKLVTNLEE